MVSFSCEACGDVIKKLDGHKSQCHAASFTCLDCNQTFSGSSYKAHNSCITEKEKYEGGAAKAKKSKKSKVEPAPLTAPLPVETVEPTPAADFVSPDEAPPAKKQKKEKKEKKAKATKAESNGFHAETEAQLQAEAASTEEPANGSHMFVNADRAQQLAIDPAPSYIALDTGDGTQRAGSKSKKRKRKEEEEVEDEVPELDPTQIPLTTIHGRPRTPAEIKRQARLQRKKEAAQKREERKLRREAKSLRKKAEKRTHIGRLEKVRDPDSPIARLYKYVALTTHDAARPMPLNEIMPKAIERLQQELGGDPKEYEELFMSEFKILSQKGRMRIKI